MRRITGVILMILGIILGQNPIVFAQTSSPLLIVAVQTGGRSSASQEFIELANVSAQNVSLNGVSIEYFSATSKDLNTPTRTIKLSGNLLPGQHYLVATPSYTDRVAQQQYLATLAAGGGHLRLNGTIEYDFLAWGNAIHTNSAPALPPAAGETLSRRTDDAGMYINSGNNADDFTVGQAPPVPKTTYKLELSELFPDPVSPQTDANDEFIEIYNPEKTSVNLEGYGLLIGLTKPKKYIFPSAIIEPGRYLSWKAVELKLTLANSGSRVQLLTPDGSVLDSTDYTGAIPGSSWAKFDGQWKWTTSPSAGAQNVLAKLPTTPSLVKTSLVKKSPLKRKTANKIAKKSKTRGKVKSAATQTPDAKAKPIAEQKTPVHSSVVAGVGGVAVLYGVYEYWDDIKTRFKKRRSD